ncbi:MAG TPA: hypothetical protein P5277_02010 [Candidatus Paceibacterota bacterium]|nr:hypothetical protein [Candidatus Paceibacterota bacterium]
MEDLEKKLDDSKKASISRGGAPSIKIGQTTYNQKRASIRKKVIKQIGGPLIHGENLSLDGQIKEYAGSYEIDEKRGTFQINVYGDSSILGKIRELPNSIQALGKEYKLVYRNVSKVKTIIGFTNSNLHHKNDWLY